MAGPSTGPGCEPVTRRESWGSRGAFIVAAIGAAVGLGNVWRFSYVAGENGGATFLLAYLLAIVLLGIPLVIAEVAIGRHSQADAVESYRAISRNPLWIAPGVLLTALLVGWRWSAPALRETALEGRFIGRLWIALLRFVIPPLIVAIFLRAIGVI